MQMRGNKEDPFMWGGGGGGRAGDTGMTFFIVSPNRVSRVGRG